MFLGPILPSHGRARSGLSVSENGAAVSPRTPGTAVGRPTGKYFKSENQWKSAFFSFESKISYTEGILGARIVR